MNKNQFLKLLLAFLLMSSCKKEQDAIEVIDDTPPPITFKAESYFSATVLGEKLRVDGDSSNHFSTNAWFGNVQQELSVVQFGNYFDFNNRWGDRVVISFAQSYHDSLLLRYADSTQHEPYNNLNPFKYSSHFHDIFSPNGIQPFFYSENHEGNQIPSMAYNGLVVEYKYNGKWYTSNFNYTTSIQNTYEILKYDILRDSSSINTGAGIYLLPYGKVKARFNCYLQERNGGSGRLRIENAEFEGIINEN